MTQPTKPADRTLAPGARRLAPMHISIRVPWHDRGWDGHICNDPGKNLSCLALSRIAAEKDDGRESAGAAWNDAGVELPPCAAERGAFMAPFSVERKVRHPYADFSEQHRHFKETTFTHPPYSAAAVPFFWMVRPNVEGDPEDNVEGLATRFQLNFNPDIEPEMQFETDWVQNRANQGLLLDTFFSAVEPHTSLCFFYAKRTPLSDDRRRVIVGVGRVLSIGPPVDYEYSRKRSSTDLEGMLWERNVLHSIRPDFEDGFLLPYQQLLAGAAMGETDGDLDSCLAFAPDEHWGAFSFGSEHVSQDAAIASLLSCAGALREIEKRVPGPWVKTLDWISARLAELWRMRGAFPGFGAALKAFDIPVPALLAHEVDLLARQEGQTPFDPWAIFRRAIERPGSIPGHASSQLGHGFRNIWEKTPADRKALLELLSRFPLTEEQACRWYKTEERREAGFKVSDADILKNPYRIFECDRRRPDAISLRVIDRGLFPDEVIRQQFPIPSPSAPTDAADGRRLRAAACDVLTRAATEEGHTLVPLDWLGERAAKCGLEPPCALSVDHLRAVSSTFGPVIEQVSGPNDFEALQLSEYGEAKNLIAQTVLARVKPSATRHAAALNWQQLVASALTALPTTPDPTELRAREEKAAALRELYESRFSMLLGGAGTGKTTLLKALCGIPEVAKGGVMLLAPTGKARVRLEQGTGRAGAQTIAQFLLKLDRYDTLTGAYHLSESPKVAASWKTVIIDESSMLTEMQLAAVLQALRGVDRIVLVGDPRQLPPIGEGRPFADIASRLQPRDAAGGIVEKFPMIDRGYAELTVTRRQLESAAGTGVPQRDDVRLASWFGGRAVDPAADELWHQEGLDSENLRLVSWKDEKDLQRELVHEIRSELTRMKLHPSENGFGRSLGAVERKDGLRFELETANREGASRMVDAWQILSPIRGGAAGVEALNQLVKVTFRAAAMQAARAGANRVGPKPIGPQGIVYGDKVINGRNGTRVNAATQWPHLEKVYVANGELGVVVGQLGGHASRTLVEFQSSRGKPIKYTQGDFEADAPLELAYALTVHRCQGSEFGTTFVVIPGRSPLLSRELFYTALTRHQGRLVVLHQGPLAQYREYAETAASAIARRLTNLFAPPTLMSADVGTTGTRSHRKVFLEEKLIHRAEDGTRLRSKSELVIAQMLFTKLKGRMRFAYEHPLLFPDGKERIPDFTIWDDDAGRVLYWEHSGFMHDEAYRKRWNAKLVGYRALGIGLVEDGGGTNGTLIFTRDDLAGGLDAAKVAEIIRKVVLQE